MKCKICHKRITTRPHKNRKFCGRKCLFVYFRKYPNKGSFKKGQTSWNKGKYGIRNSPKTEFKKGQMPKNYKPVGSIYLNSIGRYDIKIAHPKTWKRLATYNWEKVHGKIKNGMFIHHKDGNPLNDDIKNLELVNRSKHLKIHRDKFNNKRLRNLRIALKKRFST